MPTATPDRAAHRAWLVSLTQLPRGGTVVDLGCGRGEDLELLRAHHADGSRFIGMDSSAELIAAARGTTSDPRVAFEEADLSRRLPIADESVDLVFSHNLVECLPDADAFAREIARILRPGGQVVIAHWDWDTQVFDGSDKALIRRLVGAYSDWQQAWMANADGWMGRRLGGVFGTVPGLSGVVHARVLTSTTFVPGAFGHENAHAFQALARRGLATAGDCDRFLSEQEALAARGKYFYSITGYAFVGTRGASRGIAG